MNSNERNIYMNNKMQCVCLVANFKREGINNRFCIHKVLMLSGVWSTKISL